MGFESLLPDHAAVAQMVVRFPERSRPRVRAPPAAPCLTSIVAMFLVSNQESGVQFPGGAPGAAGSIGKSSGLLIHRVSVRVARGVPSGSEGNRQTSQAETLPRA